MQGDLFSLAIPLPEVTAGQNNRVELYRSAKTVKPCLEAVVAGELNRLPERLVSLAMRPTHHVGELASPMPLPCEAGGRCEAEEVNDTGWSALTVVR